MPYKAIRIQLSHPFLAAIAIAAARESTPSQIPPTPRCRATHGPCDPVLLIRRSSLYHPAGSANRPPRGLDSSPTPRFRLFPNPRYSIQNFPDPRQLSCTRTASADRCDPARFASQKRCLERLWRLEQCQRACAQIVPQLLECGNDVRPESCKFISENRIQDHCICPERGSGVISLKNRCANCLASSRATTGKTLMRNRNAVPGC